MKGNSTTLPMSEWIGPRPITKKPPVLTKRDFVRRYMRGEFGNCSPTWDSLKDWEKRDPRFAVGFFHIRNRIAGGPTWYLISELHVRQKWRELVAKGVRPGDLYISCQVPHDVEKSLLLQGEVRQSKDYIDLTYTQVPLPMRPALAKETKHSNWLPAVHYLLRAYLCPQSLEWLNFLMKEYDEHVIEFSAYGIPWGTLPGYNTVFWEVRKY